MLYVERDQKGAIIALRRGEAACGLGLPHCLMRKCSIFYD